MQLEQPELTSDHLRAASDVSLILGFASIVGSLAVWFSAGKVKKSSRVERLAIFIGLWVPSFFILSNRLARKAEELDA